MAISPVAPPDGEANSRQATGIRILHPLRGIAVRSDDAAIAAIAAVATAVEPAPRVLERLAAQARDVRRGVVPDDGELGPDPLDAHVVVVLGVEGADVGQGREDRDVLAEVGRLEGGGEVGEA